jgi:hypothetical protein
MSQFMLLLYDRPEAMEFWSQLSPDEIQAGIAEYTAWSAKLAEAGRLVGGEKLADGEGRVLRGVGTEMTVTDGPFSETKELIGGYFIIEAASYEEAVRLASDCPHLQHGTVEIRAIDVLAAPEQNGEVVSA